MTFPKQLCLALAALGLALPAAAQFPSLPSTPAITFVRERTGEGISEPVCYADGTPLLAGEFISPLYVLTKEELSAESPLPFTVSSDGTVTPTDSDTSLVWANVGSSGPQAQVKIPMKDGLPEAGWAPLGTNGSYEQRALNCSWPTDGGSLAPYKYCSLYLLTFDTRTSNAEGAVDVGGENAPIYAWAATFICSSESLPSAGFTSSYVLNVPKERQGVLEGLWPLLFPPTYLETALTDQAAEFTIAYDEVPVDDKGTPAGSVEAAEAALTPGVESMTQEGGTLTLGLTPPAASGLTLYALWTATALNGEWRPFAEVAKEKGLALEDEMRYSRLRIEEAESLEIPMFEGESTRFYRLQALGSVVESGE